MPATVSYEARPDFRAPAVKASVAFLEQLRASPSGFELVEFGVSLCVPNPDDPDGKRRILSTQVLVSVVVAFGTIALGITLILLALRPPAFLAQFGWISIWPGVIVTACGGVLFYSLSDIEKLLIRRSIRTDSNSPGFCPSRKPIVVNVNEVSAKNSLSLLDDDEGLLYCDPARQVLLLLGISNWYVIWARDIVECYFRVSLSVRGVVLKARIAGSETILSLRLTHVTAIQELRRQMARAPLQPALMGILRDDMALTISEDPTKSGGKS